MIHLLGSTSAAIIALGASHAWAADAPAGRNEIVVTATLSSDATIANTPTSAQVISGDVLKRQNPISLADLLDANLGSVSLSNGTGNPYQSDVAYRGFQATSLLGSPTGLSVYLDGVRMNEPFGSIVNWDLIPMNAITRVAVLPGSNPVFGLNTLGGALVLDTKNGAENGGVGLTLRGGSFNRRAVTAEAGDKLAGNALDWFIAGNWDKQDGYRWYTQSEVKQLYGKLRWHGAGANLELGGVWTDTALNGTQALPLSMLGNPQQAYTWPDQVANRQVIINLKGDARLAPWSKFSGNAYYRRSTAHGLNSNASNDDNCFDGGRDCTASAPGGSALDLNRNNPFPVGTPKYGKFAAYGGSLPIADYTDNINTTLVTSDTRQNVWGGNALITVDPPVLGFANNLDLGGSFEVARADYGQNTALAYLVDYQTVPMPWNFKYGSAAGFQGSPLVAKVTLASRNDSFNVFVRDVLRLTPTLSLTGSLSYTHSSVTLDGTRSRYLNDDGGFSWTGDDGLKHYNPAYIGASYWTTSATAASRLATTAIPSGGIAGPEVAPVVGSHNYHRWNPSVGLAWNPHAWVGLFASYSEAMRAPTAIELACADPAAPCSLPTGFNGDPDLQPVVAKTVELGARGTVLQRVSWNAAFYRTRLANDIQFIFDSSGLGYFANVGATERKGFELGFSADLDTIQLSASYGYVDAAFRSSFTDAGGDTVVPGNRIPGIPRQSFKLRAAYAPVPMVELGANLIALASQYAHGDEANLNVAVPGYALVNLDAHIRPARGLELFAEVTNLFDRRHATFGVMGTNVYTAGGEQFRTPAQGRAILVGVRWTPAGSP